MNNDEQSDRLLSGMPSGLETRLRSGMSIEDDPAPVAIGASKQTVRVNYEGAVRRLIETYDVLKKIVPIAAATTVLLSAIGLGIWYKTNDTEDKCEYGLMGGSVTITLEKGQGVGHVLASCDYSPADILNIVEYTLSENPEDLELTPIGQIRYKDRSLKALQPGEEFTLEVPDEVAQKYDKGMIRKLSTLLSSQ